MAETTIFEFEVNSDEAVKRIIDFRKRLSELKDEKKKLEKELKDNPGSEDLQRKLYEVDKTIKSTSSSLKAYEKEMEQLEKINKAQEGSLDQLRAKMAALTKEWDAMSKADREGAIGQETAKQMGELYDEITRLEQSTGRFQRNVGNYKSAFDAPAESVTKFGDILSKVFGNNGVIGGVVQVMKGFGEVLGKAGEVSEDYTEYLSSSAEAETELADNATEAATGVNGVGGAFKQGVVAVKAFATELLKLLANPIVAVIAAIALVVMELVKAFKKNDDAMTALQEAFSVFQPVLDVFNAAIQLILKGITKLLKGFADMANAIASFLIPALGEAQKAARDLITDLDELEERQRRFTVQSAKDEMQIAELRSKAKDKEKFTAEERMRFLEEALALEQRRVKEEAAIAAEQFRIAKAQAQQDKDFSDERKNQLAQLESEMYKAQTRSTNFAREMEEQRRTIRNEIAAEENAILEAEKRRTEEYKRVLEERRQIERQIIQMKRETSDILESIQAKDLNNEVNSLRKAHQRRVEDLRQLAKEQPKLQEEINAQIVALNLKLDYDIAEAQSKAAKEKAAAREAIEKGLTEKRYAHEKEMLEHEYQMELAAITGNEEEIANKKLEVERAFRKKKLDNLIVSLYREMETELASAEFTEEQKEEIRNRYFDKREKLVEENALFEASVEKQKLEMAKKSDNERVQSNLQAAGMITSSFSNLLNQMASDNEEMSGFLKAVALANILTNTAVSIAAAIKGGTNAGASTGVAAPITTPLFIAELIGIVLGSIGQAYALFSKAGNPKAPKFATGGLVTGEGTATSDSVAAMLSNGESVINARSTAQFSPLLSAINVSGGGTPFPNSSSNDFRKIMQDVFADMPAPVVSVREINSVNNRVKVKENIRRS